LSIGSLDQFMGVGVGLGTGVALRAGAGLCVAAGVCAGTGFSARTARAPSVTAIIASAQIAARSPPTSRAERDVCFIGEIPFNLIVVKKLQVATFVDTVKSVGRASVKNGYTIYRRKRENIYLIMGGGVKSFLDFRLEGDRWIIGSVDETALRSLHHTVLGFIAI
jgi:hypothetical protein